MLFIENAPGTIFSTEILDVNSESLRQNLHSVARSDIMSMIQNGSPAFKVADFSQNSDESSSGALTEEEKLLISRQQQAAFASAYRDRDMIKNPVVGWMMIIGFIVLVIFVCMIGNGQISVVNENPAIIALVFGGLFLLCGILVVNYDRKRINTHDDLNYQTYATCVGYQYKLKHKSSSHGARQTMVIVAPVYDYELDGQKIRAVDNEFTRSAKILPKLNETDTAWCDPARPGSLFTKYTAFTLKRSNRLVLTVTILAVAFCTVFGIFIKQ